MKKPLLQTLQNIADNTLSDNSMSNFLVRNLAVNVDISKGAANARAAKLASFGYVRTEQIGQGILIAITEAGREALKDNPVLPAKASKQRKSGTKTKKSSNPIPDGYVLLKDFVKSPGAARRKLRALQEPKPCSQWAWPKADIDRIKKLVGEA